MYKSLKKEDGTYTIINYVKQGWALCSPQKLNKYIKKDYQILHGFKKSEFILTIIGV